MREVFVNSDHARVGFYKSVLEEAGIANFVRNDNANNIEAVPLPIFFPALCVVHDEDYEEAMRLLGEIHDAPASKAVDWNCAKCGEEVPGSFDSCWQCGELRAGATANGDQSVDE